MMPFVFGVNKTWIMFSNGHNTALLLQIQSLLINLNPVRQLNQLSTEQPVYHSEELFLYAHSVPNCFFTSVILVFFFLICKALEVYWTGWKRKYTSSSSNSVILQNKIFAKRYKFAQKCQLGKDWKTNRKK